VSIVWFLARIEAASTVFAPRANVMPITQEAPARFTFHACQYPSHPGCYLMKDADGDVIYVGKAKSLREHLSSYFRASSESHRKAEMIARIREIEISLVRDEREALVLESNLIRHLNPPYNSRFTRDDDSYYYIARTNEAYPRFVPFRKRRVNYALTSAGGEASALFGPYVGRRLRNRILHALRTRFPIRLCHTLPEEPCPRLETGCCFSPCAGLITNDAYRRIVTSASRFLRRPPQAFLRSLHEQMQSAADQRDYERARHLRDRFVALTHAVSPQAAERSKPRNADVLCIEGGYALMMHVRRGVIVGLGALVVLDQSREGLQTHLLSAYEVTSPDLDLLIANRAIDRRRLKTTLPIVVPRTAASYAGQLLEICRINHEYRMQVQIEWQSQSGA